MTASDPGSESRAQALLQLPAFKSLIVRHRAVSFSLTAVMLLLYFGFILVVAWRRDLLAMRLGEHLTLGLPVGVGLILASFLLTGVYVRWANRNYDQEVEILKASLGRQTGHESEEGA
ncbi:MAG TPA: DUF485 domain-containing protein [Candidatus Obscuribacterales bacterium]